MTADGGAGAGNDLVEEYLDRVLVSVSGSPRQVRHTLTEVEAHLHDAVAEGVADGLTQEQAQARAVRRMGPVSGVSDRPVVLTRPSAPLLRRLVLTAALVGGAGLVAVGGSGLIARLLVSLKGNAFLLAPFPPGTYTRADCARWLSGDPGTHSCVTAMLADHVGDTLLYTAAGGLLGLITLAAYLVLRRRWRDRATLTALPSGTAEALGAGLAALAAVTFVATAADTEAVQHGIGAGQPWSMAAAAAITSVAFGLALLRTRRAAAR